MKMNRTTIQTLVSCMFSFLLTLFFIILFTSAGFVIGFFDNKSITRAIYESSYYNKVYDNLSSSSEEIMNRAGIPVSVLDGVITLDRVYIGGKNYIDNVFRGGETTVKIDKLTGDLSNNINTYLQAENIERTKTLDKNINNIVSLIGNKYKEAVRLKLAEDIVDYKAHYMNILKIVMLISVLCIGALSFLLVRIYKYKHRGIRYIVYALMTSSLLTIASAVSIIKTNKFNQIKVDPDYYMRLVTAYLKWDTTVFVYIGALGLTIAVALSCMVYFMKKQIAFQ